MNYHEQVDVPNSISEYFDYNSDRMTSEVSALCLRFVKRLFNKTLFPQSDGTIFVITGDIPAMWIRDSTWQVLPLLELSTAYDVAQILGAVSRRQADFLMIDPYANAFNEEANGNCWHKDFSEQSDWVFERKFELDSWTTFLELAIRLHERTGYREHLDSKFWSVVRLIMKLSAVEQRHDPQSYRFTRENCPAWDQLSHSGYGAPFGYTGMIWSAFRPSDDRCVYSYHVPSNAHMQSVLKRLVPIADKEGYGDLVPQLTALADDIEGGIAKAIILNGLIPYEVDGLGNAIYMDDPNIPSLLSLPELGWCEKDDQQYLDTRQWLLSEQHQYFHSVGQFEGFSSDHTPFGFIWPLSIAMRGLTSSKVDEQEACLRMLLDSDAETSDMHESFNAKDVSEFTRPWFSWADMLFVQLASLTAMHK